MNLGHITPHPDAPDSFITMKAPPGMENCVDLDYRIVDSDGRLALMAEFLPTKEEIELMAAGQPVRFLMMLLQRPDGSPLVPPIAMWAREIGEV
ncbi:hypothetical protein LAV_00123 [Sphingobium phage Lacusarx]|uniref:Uncharacterized protein n=1 Tax=Sphingobium phage Lacusarx TaxID=1980139 RepID=A0A1W6DX56_9CAUD|nr:hypothetical protein FDH44_gp180 [Sphingobium phage Lacusarx]ARK07498.1 hypothetical protein LAV_00123 [Sphingobium phage Lacusarx]